MRIDELSELKKGDVLWSNIGLGTATVTTGRHIVGRRGGTEVEVRRQFGDKSKFRLSFVSVDLWRRTEEPEVAENPHIVKRVRRQRGSVV